MLAGLLGYAGLAGWAWPGAAAPSVTAPENAARKNEASLGWFREAKFGLFIHWGLYAIPARGEWVMSREKIPVAKYAELAPQFNPTKFDAAAWVRVAKEAGMRYIVITAKHHDGFAMFDSATSPYNIAQATPFKRDPLKELAAACAAAGLGLGFYYSQAQDWHHPGGGFVGKPWDDVQRGDFDRYFDGLAIPQIKELLSGYGPIRILWCDTPVEMTRERAERLVAAVRATQPGTLINSRLLFHGRQISGLKPEQFALLKEVGVDYLSYRDREIPQQPQWRDWETCMTLNQSWGFNQTDQNWKSPAVLVNQLVEVASKGGNFLLNVGPTAEGEIPAPSVRHLKAVGDWLRINGEAIYGAEPSPFPPAAKGGDVPAWRCTTKPGKIYIHLLKWPSGEFKLAGVKAKVIGAHLLADARRQPLAVKQTEGSLAITLPAEPPGELVNVLCLTAPDAPP